MTKNTLVTENHLDSWVRSKARDAQGTIVDLVYRLVAASSPKPKDRRFPLGDSIGQHGADGILDVDFPYEPFVPDGHSFWEIGTGTNPRDKATQDYQDLVTAIPEEVRKKATFVFVTPLSGKGTWEHTWKEGAQAKWLENRRNCNRWKDVRVIDGTKLIDWLQQFPAVERWLAGKMEMHVEQLDTLEQVWGNLRTIGEPPPLIPQLFLVDRDKACAKLGEVFAGNAKRLRLDSHFPNQLVDFVAAYVAALDDGDRPDAEGRCLVVSGVDAWNEIVARRDPHILVADHKLDLAGDNETKLLEKARRAGHSVIFVGSPGGIPDPNRERLLDPRPYRVKDVLQQAGHSSERARVLAQKSDGNLSSLLRILQNLSLMPGWAEQTPAAELAIAELLGAWDEQSEADIAVVEGLSGNVYGEWIEKMRDTALRPGTPLTQQNGKWKFTLRYEGWYALGPRLFDQHLDKLGEVAVSVLRERDPRFNLPPEKQYMALVYGKKLSHSNMLRNGLTETLALLGSYPDALKSCSFQKAEITARKTVQDILSGADWILWASLDNFLPLLAEAAPIEFLDEVEKALETEPCPFDSLFTQERAGIMGANHITGLLWALETLAWDEQFLTRVTLLLGALTARDPGGNWANRPANSLKTIFFPWYPQTCASIAKRQTAVVTLLDEFPDVAWKLLLGLLPDSHAVSMGSHKPEWRKMIPDDWSEGITYGERWEQEIIYANMAITTAKADLAKLSELVDRLDDLPLQVHEQLLEHLSSDQVALMSEEARLHLWRALVELITRHRRFSDTNWAMKPEQVDKIAVVAERLAPDSPFFRHQRLFGEQDWDLYEKDQEFEEEQKRLRDDRQIAIQEIAAKGGTQAVILFTESVQSPWKVGMAYGAVAPQNADHVILPDMLVTEQKPLLVPFAGGFVLGKFRTFGWPWIDGMDTSQWLPAQTGQLLAYLPFTPDTWERSERLLGKDESYYWSKTNFNPYDTNTSLEQAIDKLTEHGRPNAALSCLEKMLHHKQPF
ncbi:MAG: hypothetical protein HQL80_12750, partial [Magnetococcales bacterium]|nr:hypothetical protein [Magnetococcales bacterium]